MKREPMLKTAMNTCYFFGLTLVMLSAMIFCIAVSSPEAEVAGLGGVGLRAIVDNMDGARVGAAVDDQAFENDLVPDEQQPLPLQQLQRQRRFSPFHFSKSMGVSGGFGL